LKNEYYILTINPGSTSTKVAFFINNIEKYSKNIPVPANISTTKSVWDQYEFREKEIYEFLNNELKDIEKFDAIVGRGGLLRPVEGGCYSVNEKMITDAQMNLQGEHIANIGCALAYDLARKYKCGAYIVDPVSVDEFEPLAYFSGLPEIKRLTLSHALNLHAVSRIAAKQIGKELKDSNLIIAHLGGGITIAPIRGGKIIDVNDASSDGPFSPERVGSLPSKQLLDLCYSQKYSKQELRKLLMGKGGLYSYLGTNSAIEVENRIKEGDNFAFEIYQAMAYQISKEIGAMATVLNGKIDKIVFTGGLAKSAMLIGWIKERVSFIADTIVFTGENEMLAMAEGVLRILNKEEEVKVY
jgi:butyrate kinase